LIAGLIAALSASPMVAAADENLPTVRLEIELHDQGETFSNVSGLTLRIDAGDTALLRLSVFDPLDPDTPMTVDDPTDLLEIRHPGASAGIRLGDWNQIEAGVYETTYVFDEAGSYDIVVLPDMEDRSALPGESTDGVTVRAESPQAGESGASPIGLIAALVLVVGVATLVVKSTSGRPAVPKEPISHDSWWNGP